MMTKYEEIQIQTDLKDLGHDVSAFNTTIGALGEEHHETLIGQCKKCGHTVIVQKNEKPRPLLPWSSWRQWILLGLPSIFYCSWIKSQNNRNKDTTVNNKL